MSVSRLTHVMLLDDAEVSAVTVESRGGGWFEILLDEGDHAVSVSLGSLAILDAFIALLVTARAAA